MTSHIDNRLSFGPGDVLAGKYRVERLLGQGGMGVVVAAHHIQLDEKVALKFLLPDALHNSEAVARFVREARAAAKIKNEHVARVSDVGQLENGCPYMVLEYLEGGDLAAWLHQRGPLSVEDAVDFVLQACEAIADAHAVGIVHRDLKPANLFCIQGSTGNLIIKVLDFGISKVTIAGAPGHDMTRTNALMGSPLYMSPEQMERSKGVDVRTDIWSLGVILFELLTGKPPFEAEAVTELAIKVATQPPTRLSALLPSAPLGLEQVIGRCLEKERERRFQTVGELAIALKDFGSKRAKASVENILGTLRKAGMSAAVLPPSGEYRSPAAPVGAVSGSVPATTGPPNTQANWGQTAAGAKPADPKVVAAVAAAALVGTLVLGGGALFLRRGTATPASASSGPASSAPAVSLPAPAPSPSFVAAAPDPSASASAAPVIAVSPPPPKPSPPSGGNTPRPAPPSPAPPRPAAADCNPPFTIDAKGHHVPKPECL